jgi:hypothetical protein
MTMGQQMQWDDTGKYLDSDGVQIGAILDDTPPNRPRPQAPWCAIVGHRSVGRHRTPEEAMAHVEQVVRERAEALRAANER